MTNRIQSFDAVNGGRFVVGTDAQVNSAGPIYYWTAFKAGDGKMAVGTYTGNNVTPVSVTGLTFSPEAVFVMGATVQNPVLRLAGMTNSTRFVNDAGNAARITALNADGFTVGLDADVSAAPGTVTFHYVAWNEVKGEMDVGSYTGNAPADNRNITGVGFPPDLVIVKNVTAVTPVLRSSAMDFVPDNSANFIAVANAADKVQALQSDGFQIGANAEVNQNATVHFYAAWARAQQPIIITGDHQGDAVDNRVISGLGFQPDVVIIKGDVTQVAVIRTSSMTGDVSKPLTGATALTANMIQSLDLSGYTVGTNATVNGNAGCPLTCTTYYSISYRAGPGAMKVGSYLGTSGASNPITGIGFSPELVFIMSEGAHEAVHYSSANTAEFHNFGVGAGTAAAGIIALTADGFTVGTANTSVNLTGVRYHYIAWNEIPGQMDVGSYVGNVTDNRNITGVGFEPEYAIVKEVNAEPAMHRPASVVRGTDSSLFFSATVNAADRIQALQPDGFQIGVNADINEADTFVYYAWKRPEASQVTLTAVRLTSFAATRYDGGVLLKWRTGYEINNLGFHVYREANGLRTRVTPSLIAGSGLLAGRGAAVNAAQQYAAWDTAGPIDPSAVYYLEDRDFSGKSTWHGPVTPVDGGLEAPPTVTPSTALRDLGKGTGNGRDRRVFVERGARLAARGKAGASPVVVSAAEMQWTLAGRAAVKISVNRPGWYRITQPELVAAGLAPRAKARTLRLFVDGVEQAMMVAGEADGLFGPTDAIEFYGTGVDTPYTDTRTYWLVADSRPGLRVRVQPRTGIYAPAISAGSFDFTVQQKERSIYFAALRNGDAENWFGAPVTNAPSDLVFDLPNVDADGAAEIEMSIQGVTDTPGTDHVVSIAVNGTGVGEMRFGGDRTRCAEFRHPARHPHRRRQHRDGGFGR